MLELAGRSFTPADGSHFVRSRVGRVLQRRGGEAAVREMIEILIRDNGDETRFLAQWQ